jgi:hypothetical protein
MNKVSDRHFVIDGYVEFGKQLVPTIFILRKNERTANNSLQPTAQSAARFACSTLGGG